MKFYIPPQISRMTMLFAIFIVLFLILRHFLIPDTFGDLGHYRAESLEDNKNKPLRYAGDEYCIVCHEDIADFKSADMHVNLSCEGCHGPGLEHSNSLEKVDIVIPSGREFCGNCHSINSARPKKVIAQIDLNDHNIEQDCIHCHNSHQPWELKE